MGVPIGVVQGIVAGSEPGSPSRSGGSCWNHTDGDASGRLSRGREFGLRARELVLSEGSGTTVGTVGVDGPQAGASNIVPETAFLTLDLRDISGEVLQRLLERVGVIAHEIAEKWGPGGHS